MQCAIIPQLVNTKTNKKEDSKLFTNLLSLTLNNRDKTLDIYNKTKSESFIQNWLPKLKIDERGEPTIESLYEKTNLKDIITEENTIKALNKELGAYKKGTTEFKRYLKTDENYQKLFDQVVKFNSTSSLRNLYRATVTQMMDRKENKSYFIIQVVKRDNKLYSVENDKLEYNHLLNKRLKELLTQAGISIGALTELERRMGIKGVVDFDQAKMAANGLTELIRLAEGERGESALPEEFAHFAIEVLKSNPLVNRLLNLLDSKNLVEEILGDSYEDYYNLYKGDRAKLAEEAAGKLLAKHFLNSEVIPSSKPYKSLLERVIDAIKNFFKRLNPNDFSKAIYEVDKGFGTLAKNILNNNYSNELKVDNIFTSGSLYSIEERLNRDSKLLNKAIEVLVKRAAIYAKRNPESKFLENQEQLINELKESLEKHEELKGIYNFTEVALKQLKSVGKRLSQVSNDNTSLNAKAAVLLDARGFIASYKPILEDLREALLEEERYEDNRYGEKMRVTLDSMLVAINDLSNQVTNIGVPIFTEFIRPYVGDSILITKGRRKGEKISIEELITSTTQDITIFDRWLDSMAHSSDAMLKIFDDIYKDSKENSRLKTLYLSKKIMALGLELEKAGVKDTKWMIERDSNGNSSGRYIQEINYAKYKEAYESFLEKLKDKYGANPKGENAFLYKKEKREWLQNNREYVDGVSRPKLSKYKNEEFANLSPAKRKYYEGFLDAKAKLDALLPDGSIGLYDIIKIRKDALERAKSASSVSEGAKQFWENLKDQLVIRGDDIDFGNRSTLIDFEGRQVQTLPIYYTKLRPGESYNDISTDTTSTLIAYASMAYDYSEMNKIIHALELGRDLMREREVEQTQGKKTLKEKISRYGISTENTLTKKGNATSFMNRLDDFFTMQIYQGFIKDEGNIGKVSVAKAANTVNHLSVLTSLVGNILNDISNISNSSVQILIEAAGGEFFSVKDLKNADAIYYQNVLTVLSELNKRSKTNKLSLWVEKFDVLRNFEYKVKDVEFDKKSWFSRAFKTSTLQAVGNAGEHWSRTRVSLALAKAYKMKSPTGKTVSLWDAMEVVYLDPNDKELGATLEVKKGYTKLDGSEFNTEDIKKFTRKISGLNLFLFGPKSKADKEAIQRVALGRLASLYRRWIRPLVNRRFRGLNYNYDLEAYTEGYYITTFRFLGNLASDIKQLKFDIGSRWDELTKLDKANIRRCLTELIIFLALLIFTKIYEWPDDDDDPSWFTQMAEYQTRRLYTEIGALVPSTSMLNEGYRLLKSPAAGVRTLQSVSDLLNLAIPTNYEFISGEEALIESGKYEGYSKAQKIILRSPLVPFRETIYKGLHPEEYISFYENDLI